LQFLNFYNIVAKCAVSDVYSAHKQVAFLILVRNHHWKALKKVKHHVGRTKRCC